MKKNIIILSIFSFVFFCFYTDLLAVQKADFPDSSKLQKMPEGISANISENINSGNNEKNFAGSAEESNLNFLKNFISQEKNETGSDYFWQEDAKSIGLKYFNKYTGFFTIFLFILAVFAFFFTKRKKG